MNRRTFLCGLTLGGLVAPLVTEAQQAGKVHRIAFLGTGSSSAQAYRVDALRVGLRDLGYVEGKNIVIEYRYAAGKYDRLPDLVAEPGAPQGGCHRDGWNTIDSSRHGSDNMNRFPSSWWAPAILFGQGSSLASRGLAATSRE